MQQGTDINQEIDKIRELDASALKAAAFAKEDMHRALEFARVVGAKLDTLSQQVGANQYQAILSCHFDDSFRNRAKVYRKCLSSDDRQGLLGLGLVPETKPPERAAIKTDPFFGWVNKVIGHLQAKEDLTQAERIACNALKREVDKALGLHVKEPGQGSPTGAQGAPPGQGIY